MSTDTPTVIEDDVVREEQQDSSTPTPTIDDSKVVSEVPNSPDVSSSSVLRMVGSSTAAAAASVFGSSMLSDAKERAKKMATSGKQLSQQLVSATFTPSPSPISPPPSQTNAPLILPAVNYAKAHVSRADERRDELVFRTRLFTKSSSKFSSDFLSKEVNDANSDAKNYTKVLKEVTTTKTVLVPLHNSVATLAAQIGNSRTIAQRLIRSS